MKQPVISLDVANAIIHAVNLISANAFEALQAEGYLNASKPEELRRAFINYFDRETLSLDLGRVVIPSVDYILENAIITYVTPKNPDPDLWCIDLSFIIDGDVSDLVAVFYISSMSSALVIELYDVLVQ